MQSQANVFELQAQLTERRLATVLVLWGAIGFEVSNEVVDDSLDQCFLAREMVMKAGCRPGQPVRYWDAPL